MNSVRIHLQIDCKFNQVRITNSSVVWKTYLFIIVRPICQRHLELTAPPPGCRHDFTYDENGCYTGFILVCDHDCKGNNEEYRQLCDCEPSCQYMFSGRTCLTTCRLSCFCKPGHFRNFYGHCVHGYECWNDESIAHFQNVYVLVTKIFLSIADINVYAMANVR